jgi:outer membrane protein assembly factor BamA
VQFKSPSELTLRILEGPRVKLSQVFFDGNSFFPAQHLVKFFRLGEWFNKGDIEESLNKIRHLYQEHGYLRAEIETGELDVSELKQVSYFPVPFRTKKADCMTLHCKVSEGAKYHFGTITYPRNLEFSDSAVPETGELFRESCLTGMKNEIVEHIQQDGRLPKQVRILKRVREGKKQVDITVDAEVYPPLLITRIEFTGNQRFSDSFYRRELELDERSIFHPLDLERSVHQLMKAGTLSELSTEDVELNVDEKRLEVELLFRLNERKRQGIFYSFGPGQYGGLEASVFYSILNLFGLGEALGMEVSAGDITSGFAVQLASRYLFGSDLPISILMGLFSRQTGIRLPGVDHQIFSLLGARETGISGQLSYRVRTKGDVGVAFAYAHRGSETRHFLFTPFLNNSRGVSMANRVSLFRGKEEAWNLRPSFVWKQKPWRSLSLGLRGSHAFFFGNQAPLTERLFIGPDSVRGFSVAGPVGKDNENFTYVGGDTLVAFNSEYSISLAKPLSLVPFLDIGWNPALANVGSYEPSSYIKELPRCSTGPELRVKISRLPQFRLIFSWNPLRLDSEPGLAQFREPGFNFRVGFDHW